MENIRKHIVCLLMLISSINGLCQQKFFKLYTDKGADYGQDVIQLSDSNYIVTGASSSFKEGPTQAFLLKVDSLGNYLWSKNYGGNEVDWARRVMVVENTAFYMAGFTNSIGQGGYDFYLIKTNLQGDLEWEKSYGGAGWEKVNDALILPDTSIIMVGESNSNTPGDNDVYLVKTDSKGDTLWTKKWGGIGDDTATSIAKLNDSTVIVGGQIYVSDSLRYKAFLMNISTSGNINWVDTLGNWGDYIINDLCIVGNKISTVGNRINPVLGDVDEYAIQIDTSGVPYTEGVTQKSGYTSLDLISPYGSIGKYYVGFTGMDDSSLPDGVDFRTSRYDANVVWENSSFAIGSTGDDIGGQIIPTFDGGAMIVGYTSSFGSGGKNVFLAKIGPNDDYPDTGGIPDTKGIVGLFEISGMKDGFVPVKLYPNPFKSQVNVEIPIGEEANIRVLNFQGKLVQELTISGTELIDLYDLVNGMYFIEISLNFGSRAVYKIVKSN